MDCTCRCVLFDNFNVNNKTIKRIMSEFNCSESKAVYCYYCKLLSEVPAVTAFDTARADICMGSAATAALSDSTRTKSLDDLMYDVFNAI